MYDIKPLEEEWKQYQKKKKRPLYAALAGGLLLSAVLVWQYKHIDFSKLAHSFETKKTNNTKYAVRDVLINKQIEVLQIHKKEPVTEIKSVSNDISQKGSGDSMPILPVVNDIPIIDTQVSANRENIGKIVVSEKPKPKAKKVNIEVSRKKMHLDIIKSSTVSAYKDVEKRFYQSYDTDDSLFLAKSYYRKGEYKKSEFWSLQTNKINSNIEDSWLIFVKSKVKLGHRNEAIRILTSYAQKSNSSAAWNLLLQLKK